ncbi:hypothetical protein V5N11_027588 [Cardamine amara subsp. amara]|uniref:Uncharacterized protein n=1 Tax=Cardamine amara subsp. amara TaxID=228776 RepID=A0ABD0ZL95_CARAN
MKVKHQAEVPIVIGKCKDEVLYDVLPIEVGHILLERPWQSDRRVIHDGFTNRHTFEFKGRKTILIPMTPHEVYLDKIQLKGKHEQGKKSSLFAIAGKTLYDDLFDPKLFVASNRMNYVTNLAPVLPSDFKTMQVVSKEIKQKRMGYIIIEYIHTVMKEVTISKEKRCKSLTMSSREIKPSRVPNTLLMMERRLYISLKSWMSNKPGQAFTSKTWISRTYQDFLNPLK